MSELILAVEAVQIVEDMALKRKPEGMEGITFFGRNDYWLYHAIFDEKLCEDCRAHAFPHPVHVGVHLRATFPYLEIVDENRINVNVHPHCRCFLTRMFAEAPAFIPPEYVAWR